MHNVLIAINIDCLSFELKPESLIAVSNKSKPINEINGPTSASGNVSLIYFLITEDLYSKAINIKIILAKK